MTIDPPTYNTRPTRWHIMPQDEPLFSERATVIEIVDEAAGEFVVIRQQADPRHGGEPQQIAINDRSEWAAIQLTVEHALDEIEENHREEETTP